MTAQSILAIFGAGASYDSLGPSVYKTTGLNSPWRPPLARELFEPRHQSFGEVVAAFPAIRAAVARMRAETADGTGVEEALGVLEQEANGGNALAARAAMATRIYVQHVIARCGLNWPELASGVTNYVSVVERMERWRRERSDRRICYVTFNYDRMLEEAHKAVKGSFGTMQSYVEDPNSLVVKPHGSVNWGHIITNARQQLYINDRRQEVIDRAAEWELDAKFVNISDQYEGIAGEHLAVPALMLPTTGKLDFECPPEQKDALIAFLPTVTTVFIVGWRASETYFTTLLAKHLRRDLVVLICSTPDGRAETEDNLRGVGVTGRFDQVGGAFSELADTRRVPQQLFV